MIPFDLTGRAEIHLHCLAAEITTRAVGSDGNRQATDYFAQTAAGFGFQVEQPEFDCLDWREEGARLTVGGDSFEVRVSPYSLGGRMAGPLVAASTVAELEALNAAGAILLLRGELAREQLMPKNFPFYNPDEHRRIIDLLEAKRPAAIVAATSRNPEMAGAVYPFPLIEDGDFDIPSVYMTAEDGGRLARRVGREAAVDIRAERRPARGANVVARKSGRVGRRVVFMAHIDAKAGTPGALDNAAGVVSLLLLAELLSDYGGRLGVEIVAVNGEDYYAASGERLYLEQNRGRLDEIVLGVNVDGVGYREGRTAYSLFGCPDDLAARIRGALGRAPGLVEGEPWYQSDHMIFVQNGVSAVALTSEPFMALLATIVHTADDRPELVDARRLAVAAAALRDLLMDLDEQWPVNT